MRFKNRYFLFEIASHVSLENLIENEGKFVNELKE